MTGTGKKLRKVLDRLKGIQGQMSEIVHAQEENRAALEQNLKETENLRAAAGRHDLAIEDMLDSLAEWKAEQEETEKDLRNELLDRMRSELKAKAEQEKILLDAVMAAADQLHALRRAAESSGDESWNHQIALAEELLDGKLARAQVQMIRQAGAAFSYDLHEALDVRPAESEARNLTVAEVCSPGYLYQGKVVRKAGTAVYRLKGEEKA